MKERRIDEALRFLQEGLAKPGLVLKWKEPALDAREALISVGKSPTEARVLSSLYSFSIPPEIIGIATQGSAQVKQLLENGREDEAFTLAGQLLGLGNRLEDNFGQTSIAEVIRNMFKKHTLDALPKDVEIGDTGKTAEEMFELNQEEISAFTAETSNLNKKMEWHLQNLDDVGVELFYQIFEERGYRAALEWADSYHGPAPAPQQ